MSTRQRLRHLLVGQHRHLSHPADLRFGGGSVGVIGRNGGGKTNLLLLIDAAVRGDFTRFAADPTPMHVEVELERAGGGTLRYTLTRDADLPRGARRGWSLVGESSDGAFHLDEGVSPERDPFATAEFVDRPPVGSLSRDGGRFDESLGAFHAIVAGDGHRDGVGPSGLEIGPARTVFDLHYVPWEIHQQFYALAGEDTRSRPSFPLKTAWSDRMTAAMNIRSVTVRPRFHNAAGDRATFRGFDLEFELEGGAIVTGSELSYGQKRIFAFFWHAAVVRDGVVVADELANGLHHDALTACLQQIDDRQAFLATQNPLLLDHLGFEDAAEVAGGLVLCVPTGDGWRWANPSADEAARFWSAYSLGFQHVGELLREKRLW